MSHPDVVKVSFATALTLDMPQSDLQSPSQCSSHPSPSSTTPEYYECFITINAVYLILSKNSVQPESTSVTKATSRSTRVHRKNRAAPPAAQRLALQTSLQKRPPQTFPSSQLNNMRPPDKPPRHLYHRAYASGPRARNPSPPALMI